MPQPRYITTNRLWRDWTALADQTFDAGEWTDAADYTDSCATSLSSLTLEEAGRSIEGVCPDNASAYNNCGFLRSVPSGDFIWAARLAVRRIAIAPNTTSVFTAHVCFVDGTNLASGDDDEPGDVWYGAGIRNAGYTMGNNYRQYGVGFVTGAPDTQGWDRETANETVFNGGAVIDVLIQRSSDSLAVWSAKPDHMWMQWASGVSVGTEEGLFGVHVKLGNNATGHDVAATLRAFRRLDQLPM